MKKPSTSTTVSKSAAAISPRLMVDSVRDYAIFALDPAGHVVSWNQGAERTKGYSAEEILGKHYSLFHPPADIAAGRPDRLLEAALAEGRVEDLGWRVRKDGSQFWADIVITALFDDDGEHVGFAKVTRDLTERRLAAEALRASEERFRLIVESVKDYGIFMLDTMGCVVSWNAGAELLKGYTKEEITGRHFSVFYPADDVAAGKPPAELKAATRVGRFEDEGWRVRKDGTLFWANVIITAIRSPAGELLGFAKVTRDLTTRIATEQRAIADARRVAEAEAANRAKSDFLATMSHELRTPLNAIGGYTELIEMGVGGPVNGQQSEYLERIRAAQQHLLALINDLLNYSRIEAGQITYDMGSVPIEKTLQRVLTLIEPQALSKPLELMHEPCPPKLAAFADRVKLEQILLNLLSNAVKFTPAGGRITARCGGDDDTVFVSIEDTGPGIPADKRSAVFDPFVQLGRTLTHVREGTGLGLAISRDLARAMDGDLTLSSEVGKGSTFTLTMRRER